MMNKAQKRKIEVQALAQAYSSIEFLIDSNADEIKWWKESKENFLEEHPEATDTEYYDNQIEEYETALETYKKVSETIYKMM